MGMLVRTKLNELLELMNNEQHLAEERAKAVAEREKHERVQAQARSLQARVAASQGRPLTGAGVVSVVLVLIGHLSCPVVYELFPLSSRTLHTVQLSNSNTQPQTVPVFQAETKLVGSAASYDDPYGGAGLSDLPANFTCPAWQTSEPEPDDDDVKPTVSFLFAFPLMATLLLIIETSI